MHHYVYSKTGECRDVIIWEDQKSVVGRWWRWSWCGLFCCVSLCVQEHNVLFHSCVRWLSMVVSTGLRTRHGSSLSAFSSLEHVIRRLIPDESLCHTGVLIVTQVCWSSLHKNSVVSIQNLFPFQSQHTERTFRKCGLWKHCFSQGYRSLVVILHRLNSFLPFIIH